MTDLTNPTSDLNMQLEEGLIVPMPVRIIEVAKPEETRLDGDASATAPKQIEDSRIESASARCMACGGTEGEITKIDESLACMLREAPDSLFSSYADIFMHDDCREGLAGAAIPLDAQYIVQGGTDEAKLELIEKHPEAIAERDANGVPFACLLALVGSDKMRMKLISKGIDILHIGDDPNSMFGSVAYIIARYGSEATKLALVRVGEEAMMIGNGTSRSVAHAVARRSSNMVFYEFMALGKRALSARDEEGRPVAYNIACLGSDKARMKLLDMGMDVLMMSVRGREHPTVANALATHGSDAVRMALIEKGMEVLLIDAGHSYSVAYAIAVSGSEEVQIALVSKGRRIVSIRRGGHLNGVAEALAWNGTMRIMKWLEELGYNVEALFR